MSPDHPLLRAVIAEPDDDTLRLALADWFDENDQSARADFIRVQIELARGVDEIERRIELERRQAELLVAHEREWSAPFLEALDGKVDRLGGWTFLPSDYGSLCADHRWGCCVFRRGFAEYFRLPAEVMIRHGEKLASLTPVRELYLDPWAIPDIASLCRQPLLRSLTALYGGSVKPPTLDLGTQATSLNANEVNALLSCHHLKTLHLFDVVAADDVSEKMSEAFFRRFGLHLVRNPHA